MPTPAKRIFPLSPEENVLFYCIGKRMILVLKKSKDYLLDNFAIVLDGWEAASTHYVGIFATLPYETPLGYKKSPPGLFADRR